jgi:hypothetical protein
VAILELVRPEPDWMSALGVALTLPPGMRERRAGEDPWRAAVPIERPRRISDDLAWFRRAIDEPDEHGLRPLEDSAAVAAWEPSEDDVERLRSLDRRGVLDGAGFLLHDALT